MIAPTPFFADRGCHTQIYEQIRSLQKLGHEVLLCTYHIGRDMPGVRTRRILAIPWYQKLEAGPSNHKFYLDALLLLTSLRAAREFRPDVIHGHLHEGCAIGWVVSRLLRVPLLFDLQGSLTGELQTHGYAKEGSAKTRVLHRAERLIDNLPDVVVTQATSLIEELKREFSVPDSHVRMTWDGVDVDDFRPGMPTEDLRSQLQLPADHQVVVYLGVLSKYQGVDLLLEAAPRILRELPKTVFLVMGYPDVEKYREQARALGIPDAKIRFTGRIDYAQAPRYICLGDVAVSPKLAITEANGKLYNYMACALPTVAFDASVNREVLGDTGLFPRLGDAEDLARALTTLLKDASLRRKLGDAARARVVERFSWDSVAKRLVEYYGLARENFGSPPDRSVA